MLMTLRAKLILALIVGLGSIHGMGGDSLGNVRIALPVSFSFSRNEVNRTHVDVGLGFSGDYLLLRWRNLIYGPGLSVFGTVPASAGNRTVSIKPYTVISEVRMTGALDFTENKRGPTPYFSVGGQLGSMLIATAVKKERRFDSEFMYGAIVTGGVTYWFHAVGFGLCYGVGASNLALRQKLEISLQYAL